MELSVASLCWSSFEAHIILICIFTILLASLVIASEYGIGFMNIKRGFSLSQS